MRSLLSDVQELFRIVFDDDNLTIDESTTAADIEGWDTLAHINLIIVLEGGLESNLPTPKSHG